MKRWILLLTVAALLLVCFTACGKEREIELNDVHQTTMPEATSELETPEETSELGAPEITSELETPDNVYGLYIAKMGQDYLNQIPADWDEYVVFSTYLSLAGEEMDLYLELREDMTFKYGYNYDFEYFLQAQATAKAYQTGKSYNESLEDLIQAWGSKEKLKEQMSSAFAYEGTYYISDDIIYCESNKGDFVFHYHGNSLSFTDDISARVPIAVTFERQ